MFSTPRRQPKNIILAGLWCSTEKPPMQMFLKPIIEMLSKLESEGLFGILISYDQVYARVFRFTSIHNYRH